MKKRNITIAIDGFSSCGKSTMAKDLAHDLNYVYIDTGAMYRAITLYSLQQNMWRIDGTLDEDALRAAIPSIEVGFSIDSTSGLRRATLNGKDVEEEIRSMEVAKRVSPIAALDFVRLALVAMQQELGKGGGIVMDGRDIGTTVLPEAELKVFVTARPQVRAQRRHHELRSKGDYTTTLDEVLHNLTERDEIDSHRAISPLRKAEDAIVLDNSDLTIQEQRHYLLEIANERIHQEIQ